MNFIPGDKMAGVVGKDRPEGTEADAGPSADDDRPLAGICTFWHCVSLPWGY